MYIARRMQNDLKSWLVKISQGIVSFGISRIFFLLLNEWGYSPEERIAEFLALSPTLTLWSAGAILTSLIWWRLHAWTYGSSKGSTIRADKVVPRKEETFQKPVNLLG